MPRTNARVTFEHNGAQVEWLTPNTIVEVRDYNVSAATGKTGRMWIDERGRPCVRYFVSGRQRIIIKPPAADGLESFAEDLSAHAGVSAAFEQAHSPDGLHVLSVDGVDFYFNADGGGYDGWGKRVDLDRGKK